MLKPIEPSESIDCDYVVCDIENKEDGTVLDICIAWKDDDKTQFYVCNSWDKFYKFILFKTSIDKRFRKIYAHNGGGWDWLSFLRWAFDNLESDNVTISSVMADTKVICVKVIYDKEMTITLLDSLHIFQCSLNDISKKLIGKGKADTSGLLPEKLKQLDPTKYYVYLQQDCEILLDSLIAFTKLLHEKITPIPAIGLTLASTALKCFRCGFMKKPIKIPTQDGVKDFLREGYSGGRVEVFRPGLHDNITVYDVNSLYPHIMRSVSVPFSDAGYWTNNLDYKNPGIYKVAFKQNRKDIPAILSINGKSSYSGIATYFIPELQTLKRLDKNSEIKVIRGFSFVDHDIIFKEYVETLYNLRMTDKNGPIGTVCKLLMNSLYGKFGQKAEREKIIRIADLNDIISMLKSDSAEIRDIDAENNIWSVIEETTCENEHVGIAGMITSGARAYLAEQLNMDTVYCDTDSIHTTGKIDSKLVGENMGEWKIEYKGSGVYCGKKLYALKNKESEKVRVKGVRVKKNNSDSLGFRFTFDMMTQIAKGKVIECIFQSAITPRETFSGKKPCRFQNKKRRIRLTV